MVQKSCGHQLRLVVFPLFTKVLVSTIPDGFLAGFLVAINSRIYFDSKKKSTRAGIVGIGILSLPAGIAAGTGLVTGLLILIAMYLASWLKKRRS